MRDLVRCRPLDIDFSGNAKRGQTRTYDAAMRKN